MKLSSLSSLKPNSNILINFASSISAAVVAVVAVLSITGGSNQTQANAATPPPTQANNATSQVAGSTSCNQPGQGSGAPAPATLSSAFAPGSAGHSMPWSPQWDWENGGAGSGHEQNHESGSNSTVNSNSFNNNGNESYERTTNFLSGNETNTLSNNNVASGNTYTVPILNGSLNGNQVNSHNPTTNETNTNTNTTTTTATDSVLGLLNIL